MSFEPSLRPVADLKPPMCSVASLWKQGFSRLNRRCLAAASRGPASTRQQDNRDPGNQGNARRLGDVAHGAGDGQEVLVAVVERQVLGAADDEKVAEREA